MADSDIQQQTMTESKVQEVAAMGTSSNIQEISKLQLAELFEQHQKLMQNYAQLKEQEERKDKENANQLESYKNSLFNQMQTEFDNQVEQRVELRMKEIMSQYEMSNSSDVQPVESQRNHEEQPMDIREENCHVQQQTYNESSKSFSSEGLPTAAVPQVDKLKKPEWRPLPKEEPLNIKRYSSWADQSFRGRSRGKRGGDPAVRKVHQQKYSTTNRMLQTVVDLQFGIAEKIVNHEKESNYKERQENNQFYKQHKKKYYGHQNKNHYGNNNKRSFY